MAEIDTEYRYDALNRLVEVIPAGGPIEVFCYDAAGNRVFRGPAPAAHASLTEPFRSVHRQYLCLRERLERGLITGEAFAEEVNLLRVQDAEGAWWQIKDSGGSWLKWDGSSWVEGRPA